MNSNPMKSIILYNNYLEGIELLNMEERGRLLTALLIYSSTEEIIDMPGAERFVFPLMRSQIDRDREKYLERCRKNSENGRKGAQVRAENEKRRLEALSCKAPSLQEVKEFCRENKLSVSPERFYKYFNSGNWRDSHGNKVYNWRQKLLTWNLYESKAPAEAVEKPKNETAIDMNELRRSIDRI